MAEPYPIELRRRVVAAYEAGEGSYWEIAVRFAVGPASVNRWVRLTRTRGDLSAQPKAGGTPSVITEDDIAAIIDKLGDPTTTELTVEYNRGRRGKARVHVSSMKRALHRCGYVVKKNGDGRWRVCAPTS